MSGRTARRLPRDPGTEAVCAGPGCQDRDLVPEAPIPVCGRHLRKTYEFARDMVITVAGREI